MGSFRVVELPRAETHPTAITERSGHPRMEPRTDRQAIRLCAKQRGTPGIMPTISDRLRPDQPSAAPAELFHLILDLGGSEQTSFFADVVNAAMSTAAPKIPFPSRGHRPPTRDNRAGG